MSLHISLNFLEFGLLGNSTLNHKMVTGSILGVLYGRKIRERTLKGQRGAPRQRRQAGHLLRESQSAVKGEQ